jgi:metal-responsive CopG/Arc/MetJ family transcriptional regulator
MKDVAMRALVDIPDKNLADLGAICASLKVSRAEAIRQAIDHYIALHKADATAAFGLWKDRPVDGMAYQQKVREEW